MRFAERRERFRAIFEGEACVHPASVFDPMSARIAEDLGFEAGMLAGSTASLTILGAPDLIAITLTEFAEQARRVCRAGNLPLMVDADHGYGNALNVMRTVEELEGAGVAGLSIEDTVLPATFGGGGAHLLSLEESVGKMRAALAARRDPRLVVAGRTTLGPVSLDETVARLRAYEKAGVDVVFVVRVGTREELAAVAEAVTLPIVLGGSPPELGSRDELAAQGVRLALIGHQPIMAAAQAVHDTLKALRDGTPPAALTGLPSRELVKRMTRDADYARWTADFLGGKS